MQDDLNRRDFHKLTMAALGGAFAGAGALSISGCSKPETPPAPPAAKPETPTVASADGPPADEAGGPTLEPQVAAAEAEVHVCRGLNTCKGKGADGKNECAGQGACASESTHHTCGGNNACKNQGGCGDTAARNSCKGEGGCHVPLMSSAWKGARKHFEETLKAQGKEFGPAPAKKDK